MTTAVSLGGRDLLRISDLAPAEAETILDLAVELRAQPKQPLLAGATLGLYFSKHSTRTRVSFSAGMTQLGGAAMPLTPEELQLSRGESLPDTARALSRYLDALAALTVLVAGLELDRGRLAAAASDPLLLATDAAEALVREGVPFRDAHEQVAASVRDGSFEPPPPAPRLPDVAAAVTEAKERWS